MEDNKYSKIKDIIKKYENKEDSLLEILILTQDHFGFLSKETLTLISSELNVPLSHIYGVATFYEMFSLEPVGETQILICSGPACSISGSEDIFHAACKDAGVHDSEETSPDGLYSIKKVTCLGLCDQAPAALVNKSSQVNLSSQNINELIRGKAQPSQLNVTGEPRTMTRRIHKLQPTDFRRHREDGAFSALENALTKSSPEQIIQEIIASKLVGRGGAGFPTGLKWQYTRQAPGETKYVVCNFDESEPGTFKDRVLIEGDPFRIIEGMLLCGFAIGAETGYIFIRGEYPEATSILHKAIDILTQNNLLGSNILNSHFSFNINIRRGAGAYICGEETALFEAIEGNRGHPRNKPPFPTTSGLFGKPTAINNVETLAIVPDLILNGGQWYTQWGTEKSVGVKLFCLSGHVNKPGVVEVPFGITVRELIERFGGGFLGEPQGILIGGASGGFLHPQNLDTPLTNEGLKQFDVPVGSGVIMVFNTTVDIWKIVQELAHFFVHETCGRCLPCRVGTNQIHTLLEKINRGYGTVDDIEKLHSIGEMIRVASECGLGMTVNNPVRTALKNYELVL